jgi:hypothetical protein
MATAAKAKKTSGAGRNEPGEAAGGPRSIVWLSGLACGVLAAVAPGLATLGAGLLVPGMVALKLDEEPGRPVARTVLTCGLAGCVQPVITLWNTGQSFDAALAIVTDPRTIGVAWSAGAAGWLLTQLAPLLVRALLEAAALGRATRLKVARGRIVEVWGIPEAPVGR